MKKRIFTGAGILLIVAVIAFNVSTTLNAYVSLLDVTMTEVEATANGETGSHGRPLLQSSSGAYKCANCSGSDCGAAC
jgi:hypothetical protein